MLATTSKDTIVTFSHLGSRRREEEVWDGLGIVGLDVERVAEVPRLSVAVERSLNSYCPARHQEV